MDIYSFIESKAVRKHLQDMNYQFTGRQIIVIILNSPIALKDKIEALRWVSANMTIDLDEEGDWTEVFYENFETEVEHLAKLPDLIESEGDGYFRVNDSDGEFYLANYRDLKNYVMALPVVDRFGVQAEKRFYGEDKREMFIEFSLNSDGEISKVFKYCIKQGLFEFIELPVSGDTMKEPLKDLPLPFKPEEIIVPVKSMWDITYDCDIATLIEKDGKLKLCLINELGYKYDDGYDPYMFFCDYFNGDEPSDWINNIRNDSFPQEYFNKNGLNSRDDAGWIAEYDSKIEIVKKFVSE